MHPKRYLGGEEDSIAKAHVRVDTAFWKYLEEAREKGVPILDPGVQQTLLESVKHRQAFLEWYINRGALDEQISDRVRAELRHVYLAIDEVTLKLNALAQLCDKADVKLKAYDAALSLGFDVQKNVINDAIPAFYKMRWRLVSLAVKRALAA